MMSFGRERVAVLAGMLLPLGAAPAALRGGGFAGVAVPFFERFCLGCHDAETAKGGLSLQGLDGDVYGESMETWRMVRDAVHFGDMPPEGKAQPDAEQRRAFSTWLRAEFLKGQRPGAVVEARLSLPKYGNHVDHLELFDVRQPFVTPARPRIWRLRPSIYDTVTPRLGERIHGLANGLTYVDGPVIKDYASEYWVDEASTAPLLGNAKKVAEALLGERSRDRPLRRLVSAPPPGADQVAEAIEHGFVRILGRRPGADERRRFAAFYDRAESTGGQAAAAKALLTAMIMQPEFLFRSELGDGRPDRHGRVRLTGREIGFALSYALADEPVEAFVEAGAAGGLSTREEVAALVRERLRDGLTDRDLNPRVLQFFREYFDYPNATEVFKDAPPGGQHEPGWLVADLEMTIAEILRDDREVLKRLLTTREFYVNAKHGRKENAGQLERRHVKRGKYHTAFNLPPDWRWSAGAQPVRFPDDERAGVLTHPAWLAAWSGNFDNHPVQRGKWVREQLLGGGVPDVPIGVDARVPEHDGKSFRERLEMVTTAAECWRCHKSMDPLGVAFERYDHYGRYRRLDAGRPVDASGRIDRTPFPELHREFSGPVELVEFLAASERVEQVFTRYAFRYFMGRNETLGDANTLQDAHRAYRAGGGSFVALVVSLLSSDSFLLRRSPGDLPDRPSGGG